MAACHVCCIKPRAETPGIAEREPRAPAVIISMINKYNNNNKIVTVYRTAYFAKIILPDAFARTTGGQPNAQTTRPPCDGQAKQAKEDIQTRNENTRLYQSTARQTTLRSPVCNATAVECRLDERYRAAMHRGARTTLANVRLNSRGLES